MSRGVYVDGLTEHNITSARDAYQVTSNYPAATILMLTVSLLYHKGCSQICSHATASFLQKLSKSSEPILA